MLPIFGFDEDQIAEINRAQADAATALNTCHTSCKMRDRQFAERFQKWFREPSEDNQPSTNLLAWSVEQMRDRLGESHNQLVIVFCADYEIMQADHAQVDSMPNRLERTVSRPNKPQRPGTKLRDTIDAYYGAGLKAEIRISPSFFGLFRTSDEVPSQLTVFLHELSHWAAGTRDLKRTGKADSLPDTGIQKCYGISKGVQWAAERGKYDNGVMRAVQNADSVAYFIASYFA